MGMLQYVDSQMGIVHYVDSEIGMVQYVVKWTRFNM